MSILGCLRVLPIVGFAVVQFSPVQQPFMDFSIVPIAVICQVEGWWLD
jgi:hypothetical protein